LTTPVPAGVNCARAGNRRRNDVAGWRICPQIPALR
jgi:hypothetical protein